MNFSKEEIREFEELCIAEDEEISNAHGECWDKNHNNLNKIK